MAVVGVIGCGNIANVHARVLAQRDDVALAFCDRNLEKAQSLAARHGSTKVYDDLNDMLAMEKLHALYVLTRIDSHVPIVDRALKAGVHVYVEKPITETKIAFDELRTKAKDAGVVLYPGFSAVGSPAVQQAISIVQSGRYGRLITAHCDFNWTTKDGKIPYGTGDHWAYTLRGGILQNLADHPASVVVHLLEGVEQTSSYRRRRAELPAGVHDLLHVAMANREQLGSFTMSFGHGNARGALVCNLEGATIDVDLRTHVAIVTPLRGLPSLRQRMQANIRAGAASSVGVVSVAARRAIGRMPPTPDMAATINNFLSVVDGTAEPIIDLDKAAQVIDILDSAWNSPN